MTMRTRRTTISITVGALTAAAAVSSATAGFGTAAMVAATSATVSVVQPAAEASSLPTSVPAKAYRTVSWPRHNDPRALSGLNVQGKPLPVPMSDEKWLTEKVEDIKQRVVVLDFWATWCGPCIRASPTLAQLQDRHADDVAIVAVSGQRETEEVVRSYLAENTDAEGNAKYSHVFDERQRMYRSLQIRGIPHVVILSTDGVVRWQGNPLDPAFKTTLNSVVRADPLIGARQRARAKQARD